MRRAVALVALLLLLVAGAVVALFVAGRRSGDSGAESSDGPPSEERAPPRTRHPERAAAAERETSSAPRRAAPEPPKIVEQGRLAGTVLDPRGAPQKGCNVQVFHVTGEEVAMSVTDEKGAYSFDTLPEDVPLAVRFQAMGAFTGWCCDVRLYETALTRKDVALLAAVDVPFRVVLAPDRKPLAGICVQLVLGEEVAAEATTGEDGRAVLLPQQAGRMHVRLVQDAYVAPSAQTVDVWPGIDVAETVIELRGGGRLNVAVLDSRGDPARGVDVRLGVGLAKWPAAVTGEDGLAVFVNLPPGADALVLARAASGAAGRATATTGDGTSVPRVAVLLVEPAHVVGAAIDDRFAAVAGAEVQGVVAPFGDTFSVRTEPDGTFRTPPLPPGFAQVTVRRKGNVPWATKPLEPLELRPGTEERVRAALLFIPVGVVEVMVVDAARKPVEGARVSVSGQQRLTGADGKVVFEDVASGTTYRIDAFARGLRMDGEAPEVRVFANRTANAQVVLHPAPAEPSSGAEVGVTGTVLGPRSRPLHGAKVTVSKVFTFTDEEGRFRLEGLPPPMPGDPLEVLLEPGRPGLLEPFLARLDVTGGVADLGGVRLRARPYAIVRVPALWGTEVQAPSSAAFWISTEHSDVSLGRERPAFSAQSCVSYDGSWIHLPATRRWFGRRAVTEWSEDGHGMVWLARPGTRGYLAWMCEWRLVRDHVAVPQLFGASPARVSISAVARSDARVTLRQTNLGVFHDPGLDSWGRRQPSIDPFAILAGRVVLEEPFEGRRSLHCELAPGTWAATLPERNDSRTISVPRESKIDFDR